MSNISNQKFATPVESKDPANNIGLLFSMYSDFATVFTSNGTWTNPSPTVARPVIIRLVGGGGGGGSGRSQSTAVAKAGGGGGSGGGYIQFLTFTTALSTTENIVIGAGGIGGAARAGFGDGVTGAAGNPTTMTLSGQILRAPGGNGGVGGTTTGAAGAALTNGTVTFNSVANTLIGGAGSTGAANAVQIAAGTYISPTGGGGGGGVNTANSVVYTPASGGSYFTALTFNIIYGGAPNSNGNTVLGVGTGGGGGNASITAGVSGGAGGNGGFPGGGGGGGGAYGNATSGGSGKGGDGGNGSASIIVL